MPGKKKGVIVVTCVPQRKLQAQNSWKDGIIHIRDTLRMSRSRHPQSTSPNKKWQQKPDGSNHYFSKWSEVVPIPNKKSATVLEVIVEKRDRHEETLN